MTYINGSRRGHHVTFVGNGEYVVTIKCSCEWESNAYWNWTRAEDAYDEWVKHAEASPVFIQQGQGL